MNIENGTYAEHAYLDFTVSQLEAILAGDHNDDRGFQEDLARWGLSAAELLEQVQLALDAAISVRPRTTERKTMNVAELEATYTHFPKPVAALTAEEVAARAAQSRHDRTEFAWRKLCPNGSAISNPVMRGLVIHHANCLARAAGAGAATQIMIADKDEVLKRLPSGNRKHSDGSYVSRAYMKKGWSSTFSQHSVCEVSIDSGAVLLT